MKTVHGDLIDLALAGEFDVIIHGCNCFNTMGAGIARSIKAKFPQAYKADLSTAKGNRDKLGSFSFAEVFYQNRALTVVNAYTQYDFRGPKPRVDYTAVKSCFELISTQFPNARIGYPMIGTGLAGGDWDKIAGIIEHALNGLNHTRVIYRQD